MILTDNKAEALGWLVLMLQKLHICPHGSDYTMYRKMDLGMGRYSCRYTHVQQN